MPKTLRSIALFLILLTYTLKRNKKLHFFHRALYKTLILNQHICVYEKSSIVQNCMLFFSITVLLEGICLTQPRFCRCLQFDDRTECENEGCEIKTRGTRELCFEIF